MKELNIIKLGQIDYQLALKLQLELLEKRQQKQIPDTLILLEHPPIITLGRRYKKEHILLSKEQLNKNNIEIISLDRGGDVTYHGPGQLVGYTISDISQMDGGIRPFVEKLQESIISYLKKEHNILAHLNNEYTGVWVGENKISAIGLSIKKWVSMHGFALNVSTNLSHFNWIVPCGIQDKGVTSIKNEIIKMSQNPKNNQTLDLNNVKDKLITHYQKIFQYDTIKIINKTPINQGQI